MASISRTLRPFARVARSSLRPMFVRGATPQYVD
jgi:hypothetical protein